MNSESSLNSVEIKKKAKKLEKEFNLRILNSSTEKSTRSVFWFKVIFVEERNKNRKSVFRLKVIFVEERISYKILPISLIYNTILFISNNLLELLLNL